MAKHQPQAEGSLRDHSAAACSGLAVLLERRRAGLLYKRYRVGSAQAHLPSSACGATQAPDPHSSRLCAPNVLAVSEAPLLWARSHPERQRRLGSWRGGRGHGVCHRLEMALCVLAGTASGRGGAGLGHPNVAGRGQARLVLGGTEVLRPALLCPRGRPAMAERKGGGVPAHPRDQGQGQGPRTSHQQRGRRGASSCSRR
mmetsp:Transcript_1767/g.3564  ORF Transcript_1767/g.3564 Transcript_1767/m.3564 type:complete len:200 (-) Transcript_1767:91-690(-)